MKPLSPWKLALVPMLMFGFGFALVPLYDVFCAVTGLNGKNFQVEKSAVEGETGSVVVNLQLTADPSSRDDWGFHPFDKSLAIQSGRMIKTHYVLKNPTNEPVVIRAVPSVSPGYWAQYLVKIECFCFNEQAVPANGEVELPLQVTLSADTPEDVNQLTLSYRIYKQNEPAGGES